MITKADAPQHYAIKLVKNGPRVACKVWFGAPLDPITSEPLDRSPRWNALVGGEETDPDRILIFIGDIGYVKGEPIKVAEYDHLLTVREWAMKEDPSAPEAAPRQAINLGRMKTIF